MSDLLFVSIVVGFFALAAGAVRMCESVVGHAGAAGPELAGPELAGPDPVESDPSAAGFPGSEATVSSLEQVRSR